MKLLTLPTPIGDEIPKELILNDHKHTLIFGDIHSPRTNNKLIDAALKYAIQKRIPRLIILGDFLDNNYFSRFDSRTADSPDSVDIEMAASEDLFKVFKKVFDDIVLIPGNHCTRATSAVSQKISMARFYRMILGDECLKDVTMTERGYCKFNTPSGEYIATHQIGKGRSVPLSVASQYSTLNHINIICAHQHFLGAVRNRNDSGWAIDCGHFCDETLLQYKVMSPTNYTQWAPGFVEIDEVGRPNLWHEKDIYNYLEIK